MDLSKASRASAKAPSEELSIPRNGHENADEIFELLKEGRACPSQISVELGLSIPAIAAALHTLQAEGLAEPQPDEKKEGAANSRDSAGLDVAWGLATPKKK